VTIEGGTYKGIINFTPTGLTAGLVCGKGFDKAAVKFLLA
jgi:hypothetical protein